MLDFHNRPNESFEEKKSVKKSAKSIFSRNLNIFPRFCHPQKIYIMHAKFHQNQSWPGQTDRPNECFKKSVKNPRNWNFFRQIRNFFVILSSPWNVHNACKVSSKSVKGFRTDRQADDFLVLGFVKLILLKNLGKRPWKWCSIEIFVDAFQMEEMQEKYQYFNQFKWQFSAGTKWYDGPTILQ